MEFTKTKTFEREVKKFVSNKHNLREHLLDALSDFQEKLFDSEYYRKRLSGYKEDIHELQIGWDHRAIIQFYMKEGKCYYLNFGTHSSLSLTGKKRTKINPVSR